MKVLQNSVFYQDLKQEKLGKEKSLKIKIYINLYYFINFQ